MKPEMTNAGGASRHGNWKAETSTTKELRKDSLEVATLLGFRAQGKGLGAVKELKSEERLP